MIVPVRSALLALALTLAGSVAFAQAPIVRQTPADSTPAPIQSTPDQAQQTQPGESQFPAPEDRSRNEVRRELKHLQETVNLTPDQVAQIRPILEDTRQQIAALQSGSTLTPDQFKRQTHAIRHQSQERISALLTEEQRTQLAAARAAHQGRHQGDQSEPDSAPPAPGL